MSGIQYDGRMIQQTPTAPPKISLGTRQERRFHRQSELLLESVRRQTFSSWPISYIDPDELAKCGFFYLRTEDHVQCVFCQGIVGFWDEGDQPMVEHHKHFPNCPLITGAATGNVPKIGTDDKSTALFNFLHQYQNFRVTCTKPKQVNTTYQTDSVPLTDSGQLAYPHLNTVTNRLQTFSRWPQRIGVEPDALAEAGFFSNGLADWTTCFHCGGGLYGWQSGDNPLTDHARFFPFCPFVRSKLGEEQVSQNLKNNPPPTCKSRTLYLTDKEAELLLHHPMAQRLVGMGLSPLSVKEALRRRLETSGILCRTVTEALELVFDHEEKQLRRQNTNALCHDGPLISGEVVTIPTVSMQGMQTHPTISMCQDPSSQDNEKLIQEVEALRKQVISEERRLLCRLCQSAKVEVVFQPCSHLHVCAECARPRDTCPTCGAIVRGTLRPIIS